MQKKLAPRKQPVQARSRETVEAILEAAVQVFSKSGYEGGTVSRIAERAGVSIGSLYQYFPTKDAIVVALMDRHMQATAGRIGELAAQTQLDDPPLEQVVRVFVQAMMQVYLGNVPLTKVIFEGAPRPETINRKQAEVMAVVGESIAQMLAGFPEITVRDLTLAAQLLVQLVDAQTRAFVLMPLPGYTPEALADELTVLLSRYLTAKAMV